MLKRRPFTPWGRAIHNPLGGAWPCFVPNARRQNRPPIDLSNKPGQALAKAYWLIDRKEWRRAIIYLDRITRQYPNWPEAYEVKAVALKHENQIDAMRQALQRACALGSPAACADVKQPR
jgi:tetratricopeptide (TPR) repeat protein